MWRTRRCKKSVRRIRIRLDFHSLTHQWNPEVGFRDICCRTIIMQTDVKRHHPFSWRRRKLCLFFSIFFLFFFLIFLSQFFLKPNEWLTNVSSFTSFSTSSLVTDFFFSDLECIFRQILLFFWLVFLASLVSLMKEEEKEIVSPLWLLESECDRWRDVQDKTATLCLENQTEEVQRKREMSLNDWHKKERLKQLKEREECSNCVLISHILSHATRSEQYTREERNCSYEEEDSQHKGLCVFHSLFPATTRDAWISREPLAFRLIPPFLKSRASGSFLGLSSFPRMKDAIQIPWRWVRVTHNTRSKQGSKHSVAQRDERSWSWKQREEMLHDVVWISWWLLLLDTSSSRRWWRGQLCSLKSKYKSRWEEIERDRHSYLSSPSVSLLQGLPLGSFSFGFDTKKWVWKSSIHLVLDEANTMHYLIQCDG